MDKTVTFSQMIKKSNTDEWYTTAENVEMIVPFLKNKGAKKILCPFDKKQSAFVTVLKGNGFDVTYSHIETGGISLRSRTCKNTTRLLVIRRLVSGRQCLKNYLRQAYRLQ